MATLDQKAMLAALNVSQWTARKEDKKITKEVETAHNAKDAGKYHKVLIAKESIQTIQKIVNEARIYHYTVTLPWNDNGERILTTALFFDYSRAIAKFKGQFETAVNSFLDNYPALIDAARTRLNGMFNQEDYPTIKKVKGKFSFSHQFTPIPSTSDFRVDLQQEEIEKIKSALDARLKAREQEAVKDLWERLFSTVSHAAERLSDPDAIFRDSLIVNIQELVNLLPKLNFTDDPTLEKLRREVENKLLKFDAATLRDDPTARKQTAQEARELLKTIGPHVKEEQPQEEQPEPAAALEAATTAPSPAPPAPPAETDSKIEAMSTLF